MKDPTGINDVEFQSLVNIYPNPSNGHFVISLPYAVRHVTVEVLDMVGRKVYDAGSSLDITAPLAKGIYLIKITDKDKKQIATKKIAIQ